MKSKTSNNTGTPLELIDELEEELESEKFWNNLKTWVIGFLMLYILIQTILYTYWCLNICLF